MTLEWKYSDEGVDWEELSALYRAAPLGDKSPQGLKTAFDHSLFKFLVYEDGRLVEASRGHRKIILYAVPGKEAFYEKLGFARMKTAMAIFQNQAQAVERGYLEDRSQDAAP